jgi:hypothetical protein
LRDKKLSFSFKEPFDFVANTSNSHGCELLHKSELKHPCLSLKDISPYEKNSKYFLTKKNQINSTILAEGELPNFGYLFSQEGLCSNLAERVGFEPTIEILSLHSLSRRAPSANSATSPEIKKKK